MSDKVILSILSTKDSYNRYIKYVNNVSKEVATILKDMQEWWQHHDELDWDVFAAWFKHTKHASMKSDVLEMYDSIFTSMDEVEYDDEQVSTIVAGFIDRSIGDDIATIALKLSDGDTSVSVSDIRTVLDDRDRQVGEVDDEEGYVEWGKPITNVRGSIRWRLEELNAAIGPIGKGDFIVIGARPDAGKTTFLASEITHMASQLGPDDTLLWLNNEERGEKVQSRIVTSALGLPYEDIQKDWVKSWDEYKVAINGPVSKIILKDISGGYVSQIDALVKKLCPSVIVIDQLRKIHGFEREAGNETTRQELIFNWARDLAKAYAPVLTVHQADGTAENVEWIDMSQLHMSKTGIQGEADAIITIGRTREKPASRFIYVPKNKMQGDDPSLRNGMFEVLLDGARARFKGAA